MDKSQSAAAIFEGGVCCKASTNKKSVWHLRRSTIGEDVRGRVFLTTESAVAENLGKPMSLRCSVWLLAVSIPLAACSTFGDASDDVTSAAATEAVQGPQVLTSECARLRPLFAPGKAALTHDEFEAALHAEFQKWDKDGNGELTQSELDPLNDMLRAMNVGASPVTDWNGDGHVDFTEFASGWRTMFQLCDTNRDKIISFRELGISPNVTPPREEPKKPPEGASQNNPDSM